MCDEQRIREDEVFDQELSMNDLDAAAGGVYCTSEPLSFEEEEKMKEELRKSRGVEENCTNQDRRNIYAGGFPNCAATVEDGSWCGSNDACYNSEVDYYGFVGKDCAKAWR